MKGADPYTLPPYGSNIPGIVDVHPLPEHEAQLDELIRDGIRAHFEAILDKAARNTPTPKKQ